MLSRRLRRPNAHTHGPAQTQAHSHSCTHAHMRPTCRYTYILSCAYTQFRCPSSPAPTCESLLSSRLHTAATSSAGMRLKSSLKFLSRNSSASASSRVWIMHTACMINQQCSIMYHTHPRSKQQTSSRVHVQGWFRCVVGQSTGVKI